MIFFFFTASSSDYIFKGEPYWCPKIKYTEEEIDEKLEQEIVSSQINITKTQLKHLSYAGVLYEKRQTYLPDESHIKKPLAVVKSRRVGYPLDKEHDVKK